MMIREVVVKRAGGWSYGDGPPLDPLEVVRLAGEPHDSKLLELRYLAPLPPEAKPVTCECGRRFLDADALKVHGARSHKVA